MYLQLIRNYLQTHGGTVRSACKALNVPFPENRQNVIDLELAVFNNETREVYLYGNDEGAYFDDGSGFVWAIVIKGSNEYWIDSFREKEDAIRFCKKYQLKIVGGK